MPRCTSCHVHPPGDAPRSTAVEPGGRSFSRSFSSMNSISASASFNVERDGEAEGMRRRTMPMGQGELFATGAMPTWHASPPTKNTCSRSSAAGSSNTTPALRSAFSRWGMSGLVSDDSALPSLVSGMSTCSAAKRFPQLARRRDDGRHAIALWQRDELTGADQLAREDEAPEFQVLGEVLPHLVLVRLEEREATVGPRAHEALDTHLGGRGAQLLRALLLEAGTAVDQDAGGAQAGRAWRKRAEEIARRRCRHLFERDATKPCDLLGHMLHERGLVGLAAVGQRARDKANRSPRACGPAARAWRLP